jgi:hemoglobin-like flavoprotein
MGAASSVTAAQKSEKDLIRDTFSLFDFYDPEAVITREEVAFANECWKMITDNTAPKFLLLKKAESESDAEGGGSAVNSCLTWFYDKFYEFSHEMDTDSRELYKNNLRVQINALIAMIKMTLHMFKNENYVETVKTGMTKLASGHYKRGVRSFQYAIVGTVLIKTFNYCLGEEYAAKVTDVWGKLFSIMLKVLIPASIQVEAQEDAKPAEDGTIKRTSSSSSFHAALERKNSNSISIRDKPDEGKCPVEKALPPIAESAAVSMKQPVAVVKPVLVVENDVATEANTRSNSVDVIPSEASTSEVPSESVPIVSA